MTIMKGSKPSSKWSTHQFKLIEQYGKPYYSKSFSKYTIHFHKTTIGIYLILVTYEAAAAAEINLFILSAAESQSEPDSEGLSVDNNTSEYCVI